MKFLLLLLISLNVHAALSPISSGGGGGTWGSITGTLSSQTDLQSALDLKLAIANYGKCLGAGANNTCVGSTPTLSSHYNSIFGTGAGAALTSGTLNTLIGERSGEDLTTAIHMTCIGELACGNVTVPTYGTHIGLGAGYNNAGDYNVSVGRFAGYSSTSAGDYNTFIGAESGYFNTSGIYNAFLGAYSGYRNTTGYGNTFVGEQSAENVTTGHYNTALGYGALGSNVSGTLNVAVGESAGYSSLGHRNTFLGEQAGYTNNAANASTTSSDVTFVGANAGAGTATQITNAVAIGSDVTISASDAWTIGKLGSKQYIAEGANAVMGAATLVAGTVVVNTTRVTANSRIFLTHQNNSGTVGSVSVSARSAGVSFTITSTSVLDTSLVAWEIKEPK